MNTKKIIISLATTIIPVAVALADEINQTITVEREVEIVEQKVEKPYSLPEALPLKTDEVKLQFSDHTVVLTALPSTISAVMPCLGWATT